MIIRIIALAAALLTVTTCATRSAEITFADVNRGGITITGPMVIEDIDKFLNLSAGVTHAIVVFDSPGGATLAGIKMGK